MGMAGPSGAARSFRLHAQHLFGASCTPPPGQAWGYPPEHGLRFRPSLHPPAAPPGQGSGGRAAPAFLGLGCGPGFRRCRASGAVGRATGSASSSSPGSNASSSPASFLMAQHDLTRGRQLVLHGRDGGRLSLSFSVKELAQQAAGALLSSSRRFISSGTCATLVLKTCGTSRSAHRSLPVGSCAYHPLASLVLPVLLVTAVWPLFSYSAARWLWISYGMMPAATGRLSVHTGNLSGHIQPHPPSQSFFTSWDTPLPSLPSTSAMGPVRLFAGHTVHIGTVTNTP